MGNNINQRNLVRLAGLNQIQSNMGADMAAADNDDFTRFYHPEILLCDALKTRVQFQFHYTIKARKILPRYKLFGTFRGA